MILSISHEMTRHMTNPKPTNSNPYQHIKKLIAKSCKKPKPIPRTQPLKSRLARRLGLSSPITKASIRHPKRLHDNIAVPIDGGSVDGRSWLSRLEPLPWALEAARVDAMEEAVLAVLAVRWRVAPSDPIFWIGNRQSMKEPESATSSNKAIDDKVTSPVDEADSISLASSKTDTTTQQSNDDSRSSSMSSYTREIWEDNERDRNAKLDRGNDPDPDDHHRRVHLRSLLYSLREPGYIASLGVMLSRKELAMLFARLSAVELAASLGLKDVACKGDKINLGPGEFVTVGPEPDSKSILKRRVFKPWWVLPGYHINGIPPKPKGCVSWDDSIEVFEPVQQPGEVERKTGRRSRGMNVKMHNARIQLNV